MTFNVQSRRRFRTDPGFTLIEVTVALVVMAIVVTVAFSGLTIGMNSWERGSRAIDDLDRRATIERLLKRQLALAYPMQFKTGDQTFVLFRGSSHRLEFISDYSLADGPGDFRKIDYAADGGQFLYGEKPLFDYIPADNEDAPGRTLGSFKDISFRFLGRGDDERPIWVTEWKIGMGLPLAVLAQIDNDNFIVRLVNR